MAGIAAFGVHIPRHRVPLSFLAGNATPSRAERALAWVDEDSVTMAVDAARQCLDGRDRAAIDLLIFASTTHAFAEKQGAALIAAVLGLRADVRTVDVGGSLRSGVDALRAADDAVQSGGAREALVVVADCRQGAPGSELERTGGDGAAAFVVSAGDVLATLVASASAPQEIVDMWRGGGDRFVHSWEGRFVGQYGVMEPLAKVARALPPARSARLWATSAPDKRALAGLAGAAGAGKGSLIAGLFGGVGFCGAAHAPMLLVEALEAASAGQEIAVLSHGDGASGLLYRVERAAGTGAFVRAVAGRIPVATPAAYQSARDLIATEYPPAAGPGISATVHYRDRASDLQLLGQRCRCGEPQFPLQHVCYRCGAKDAYTPLPLAERGGMLVTYSYDHFFPSPEPPTAVGIVAVRDGPRIYLQLADLSAGEAQIGMPLRFVFRVIHRTGGRPNYFWKAVPEEGG